MGEHDHVNGRWQVHQGDGYNLTWELRCEGRRLSGTATMGPDDGVRAGYFGTVTQELEGELEGDDILVKIRWPAKRDGTHSLGIYKGEVHDGRMHGRGHDELWPNRPPTDWHAERG